MFVPPSPILVPHLPCLIAPSPTETVMHAVLNTFNVEQKYYDTEQVATVIVDTASITSQQIYSQIVFARWCPYSFSVHMSLPQNGISSVQPFLHNCTNVHTRVQFVRI